MYIVYMYVIVEFVNQFFPTRRCSNVSKTILFEEFTLAKDFLQPSPERTTRAQKKKVERYQTVNLVAGPSGSPRVKSENIDEIK